MIPLEEANVKTRGLPRLLPALLLPLALGACNGTAGEEGEAESAPAVASVARANLDITAEASGQVEPVRVVEVKSKASGEVLRLHVETGSTIPQGALLAEVDPRDVRNAYAQAEADLEVARERLGTAQAQKKRTLELRDANVVTAQELESATLEEANARAQLVKARTNLDLARERLNDVAIRAPIAGTVISKTVEQGSIIASASQNISGGTTLFTMADLAVMQVRALVDETDIGRISPGQTVQVTVEAYPDRRFQGTVFKIEPQAVVEQNVTMFPVLVRLDNPEGLLKPGMNADIAVEIARRENVITVPNAAIVAMRDATAAGAVLGLSEEAVQAGLTGASETGASETGASQPGAQQTGAQQPTGAGADPRRAECEALVAKIRSGGGFQSMSEADRSKMRDCRTVLGLGQGRGGAGGGGRSRNPDVRPAVVFVQTADGAQARRVMVGLNDWDNTEVISGVKEGEQIILISVARLQAQQEEFANRIRERSSPLGGGMGGPPGGGGPGGPGGSGQRGGGR